MYVTEMSRKHSFIVQGEASESDEEDYMSPVHRGQMKPNELVASIAGDDATSEDDLNITISAFASKIQESESPKRTSLFHKKLQESNWKVRTGVATFVQSMYRTGRDRVNDVNQRLLTRQVEAQETLRLLRLSAAATRNIDLTLGSLLSLDYVPSTNAIVIGPVL